MKLCYSQLYAFTEIASLDIPMKKSDLLNLVGRLDDLKLISKIHKTLCDTSPTDLTDLRCPTLSATYFNDFSSNMASKKRKVGLTLGC